MTENNHHLLSSWFFELDSGEGLDSVLAVLSYESVVGLQVNLRPAAQQVVCLCSTWSATLR